MIARSFAIALAILLTSAISHAEDLDGPLYEVPGHPVSPDFSLLDIEGKKHTLSGYRGKVVVLNFWATWCPPCRYEMPSMQRASELLSNDNVIFLAVDIGEDEDTVFTFTADYPVDFALLLDHDSSVIKQWEVRGLPTTFVIDPEGKIIYRAIGGRDWDKPIFLEKLRALTTP